MAGKLLSVNNYIAGPAKWYDNRYRLTILSVHGNYLQVQYNPSLFLNLKLTNHEFDDNKEWVLVCGLK
jgi:hypothetical protein